MTESPVIGGLEDVHGAEAVQAGVLVVRDELRQVGRIPEVHRDPSCMACTAFIHVDYVIRVLVA